MAQEQGRKGTSVDGDIILDYNVHFYDLARCKIAQIGIKRCEFVQNIAATLPKTLFALPNWLPKQLNIPKICVQLMSKICPTLSSRIAARKLKISSVSEVNH